MYEDDRDMKIAGQEDQVHEPEDLAAQQTARHKKNGNWDKAEQLGRRFAAATVQVRGGEWETNHRQLVAFAAEWVMEFTLSSKILLQAARTAFDAELARLDPDFYQIHCSTEDYSFYLFRIREDGNDARVGATFASLCAKADDEGLVQLGTQWYTEAKRQFTEWAVEYTFNSK